LVENLSFFIIFLTGGQSTKIITFVMYIFPYSTHYIHKYKKP